MLTTTPSHVRRAIGAVFAIGMFATAAAAQSSFLETFETGAITTGNGTTVVWSDGSFSNENDPTPWSAGPHPLGFTNRLGIIHSAPGNIFWQSGAMPDNEGNSIQILTVQIGPQGGTLSFDWDTQFNFNQTQSFLVLTQDQLVLLSSTDVPPWGGSTAADLPPGTNEISFIWSPTYRSNSPDGFGGVGIDNVRVTGLVPEPASLGLVSIAADQLAPKAAVVART